MNYEKWPSSTHINTSDKDETPQFTTKKKLFDSSDPSDYYSYLSSYEKHTDSIIPSREAASIQAKRQKDSDSPIKDSQIKVTIQELRDRSVKEIELYKKSYFEKEKELLFGSVTPMIIGPSPLYTPEPFEAGKSYIKICNFEENQLGNKLYENEIKLRKQLELDYEQETDELLIDYDQSIEKALTETKKSINQY